jgi:hypothetical protein
MSALIQSTMKLSEPYNSTEIYFTPNTHNNYNAILVMSIIQISIIIIILVYRIDRRQHINGHNIDYNLQAIIHR